jgi:DNA polymerase-3 subunit beta
MKFSFSAQQFFKQLQNISGVVGNNNAMPILENFLFILKGNTLQATASDLDTFMRINIDVLGEEDGSMALPSRLLMDTLRNFPDVPVTIEINEESLLAHITGPSGDFKLTGETADNYPSMPEVADAETTAISSGVLADVVSKTLFAVSTDELRPAMGGVNFEISPSGSTFVATDAHKLVKFSTGRGISPGEVTAFIVPRKALSLLKTVLGSETGTVDIQYNKSNASFKLNEVKLLCRLINAKFPDYNAVIPKNNNLVVSIDRALLSSALKRVNLFANRSTNQVQLTIDADTMLINAQDLDYSNEGKESLDCRYSGEPLKVAFNGKFFLEVVNILDSVAEIEMHFSNPSRAALILPSTQEEGQEITLLIMPIMVNN